MAGKAATGFMKFIGLRPGDDDEYIQEDAYEEVQEEPPRATRARPAVAPREHARPIDIAPEYDGYPPASRQPPTKGGNVVQHPSQQESMQHCVMFYTMSAYADTSYAIDDLLRGRSVHVNLDDVDQSVAQRILDTLSGASYALHGDYRQTAKHSYFFAPQEIQLSEGGDIPREAPRSRTPYRR